MVSLLIAQFPADPPGGGGGGNYRPRNCHNTRRFYTHYEHSPKTDVQLYCRLFEIRRKQTNGIMVLLGKHPTYHFKAFPLFTQSIFPYPFSRVGEGRGGEREKGPLMPNKIPPAERGELPGGRERRWGRSKNPFFPRVEIPEQTRDQSCRGEGTPSAYTHNNKGQARGPFFEIHLSLPPGDESKLLLPPSPLA